MIDFCSARRSCYTRRMNTALAPSLPLSAVLITRDAAKRLPACLTALDFCAELLIVDSGSTDATLTLAAEFGARVIQTGWRGFGAQKQFAVEAARHDWVLCIDADEVVSPQLRASILAVFAAPAGAAYSAYRFNRCNRFLGRSLRHGEGYPDPCLRLFDRRAARWSTDAVHEKVETTALVGVLAGDLLHDSAQTLEDYLAKQNRYTSLAAHSALAQGKHASAWRLAASPLLRFVKFYLLRGGFLDGLPGLIHILIGCGASFIKYAKMREAEAHNHHETP